MIWDVGIKVNSPTIQLSPVAEVQVGFDAKREDTPIARFSVPNGTAIPEQGFRASIAWGNGTRTAGRVVPDPSSASSFLVLGNPRYAFFNEAPTYTSGEYSRYASRERNYIARVTVQDGASTGAVASVDVPIKLGQATAGVMTNPIVENNYELSLWIKGYFVHDLEACGQSGNPNCTVPWPGPSFERKGAPHFRRQLDVLGRRIARDLARHALHNDKPGIRVFA